MASLNQNLATILHTEDMASPETESSAMEPIVIRMRVEDWQIIDGTIDNTVALAAVDGDNRSVENGQNVRQAGWDAARIHPRVEDGWGGWPPQEDEISIVLPLAEWRFVVGELHRWEMVDDSAEIRDTGMPESQSLAIAHLVTQRIGDGY